MKRLNRVQMEEVYNDFGTIAEACLAKVAFLDARARITKWWDESVGYFNIHYIFRPDKMEQLNEMLFSDAELRDFLLSVQFRFYALSGHGDGFIDDLCLNLEEALLIDGPISDYNTLPGFLKASTPLGNFVSAARSPNAVVRFFRRFAIFRSTTTIHEFLRNNPLLVIVLMLHLTHTEKDKLEAPPASTAR